MNDHGDGRNRPCTRDATSTSTGVRQEGDRAPTIVATRPVAALPPVERGNRTSTPAWMTGGQALVAGDLQELTGVQQGEGPPSVTANTPFAVVPPPVKRGRRITTPAWMRTGTRGSRPAPGGSNSRCREGRCRGGLGPNQVIGGVEHHQVIDIHRGHGRGRGTVGHHHSSAPPRVRDLRARAMVCYPPAREVGTPASATSGHLRRWHLLTNGGDGPRGGTRRPSPSSMADYDVETFPLCPTSLGFGGVGKHLVIGARPDRNHG